MKTEHVQSLLLDLWGDLREVSILWELGVLGACLLLAWWLRRPLGARASLESPHALKMGAADYGRILFPLLVMLLLFAARAVLARWQSVSLLSLAIPLFGSLAGIRFIVYALRLALPAGGWLEAFERVVSMLVWVAVALHVTGLLPEIVALLEGVTITVGKAQPSLWHILTAAFWALITLLLALWAGSALEARLMRAETLHSSLRVVLARIGKALLLVVAVLIVLPVVGVDPTLLSVFGGALGVGLGFGLQKIFSNYISGFIILFDRSIRIGDMITADNHHGEVRRITTRYVVVRSLTGVEAIVPNDTMVTTTVLNHSYSDKKVRLMLSVQVAYGSDVQAAMQLLTQIAAGHPRVLKDPEPDARIANLGASAVELQIGFWIEDPEAGSLNVRSDISLRILSEFQARGIEIPIPRQEVRLLRGAPAP